jgi:hypothetical protein
MRRDIIIFHGLFGGWGWQRLDRQGQVIEESYEPFETRDECIRGAYAQAPVEDEVAQLSEPF